MSNKQSKGLTEKEFNGIENHDDLLHILEEKNIDIGDMLMLVHDKLIIYPGE